MAWVLIGSLLGTLVTGTFDTREACEGKAVVVREKGVNDAKCFERPPSLTLSTGSVNFYNAR